MFRLFNEWEHFKNCVKDNPVYRPITLQAWQRCRDLGIQPDSAEFVFVSKKELKQRQQKNSELIRVAKPFMEHLSLSLYGKTHIVALSDSDGIIIDYVGTPVEMGGRDAGIDIGSNWSEKCIGNNGIGTALHLGEPVLIYGVEHYYQILKAVTCLGVPIRNPKKEIIGALDVSVPTEYAHPDRITLAIACANSIESTLNAKSELTNMISNMEKILATGSLLSTTVHDIKNPLFIIRGIGQLGTMNAKSEKEKEYFQKIIEHVDGLTSMLNSFVGIIKQHEFKSIVLYELIAGILQEIEPLCRVQNIKLEFKPCKEIKTQIQTELFKRAIHNLLQNATQALSKNGGTIKIRLDDMDDKFLIIIEDNGPGIPPNIQESIFQPFVQGRKSGTGLGLYMAYYVITKVHNGRIWFDTEVGRGTTFFIEIPVRSSEEICSVV